MRHLVQLLCHADVERYRWGTTVRFPLRASQPVFKSHHTWLSLRVSVQGEGLCGWGSNLIGQHLMIDGAVVSRGGAFVVLGDGGHEDGCQGEQFVTGGAVLFSL